MPATVTILLGLDTGFPDTCLTPGILSGGPCPIPYPNISIPTTGAPTATTKVFVFFCPTHTMKTENTLSNGDEAGCNGGVTSGRFMGGVRRILGSFTTFMEGMPSSRAFLDPTIQNGTNAPGLGLLPSQINVWVFM